MSELGDRIRAARGYANLSQPELAGQLGVSTSTVKRLESGKSIPQGYQEDALIEKIAGIANLPPEFFAADFARLARGRIGNDAIENIDRHMTALWRDLVERLDRVQTVADNTAGAVSMLLERQAEQEAQEPSTDTEPRTAQPVARNAAGRKRERRGRS